MIFVDHLLSAVYRQKQLQPLPGEEILLLYEPETFQEALSKAKELRKENCSVAMACRQPSRSPEEYKHLTKQECIKKVYYLKEPGQWKEL